MSNLLLTKRSNVRNLYSMGAKLTDIDKRVSPGAGTYNIPSKAVEK